MKPNNKDDVKNTELEQASNSKNEENKDEDLFEEFDLDDIEVIESKVFA